jgi:inorganic pyrophosphatase
MPGSSPANCGSISSSLDSDGDPLDRLVYSREPIVPGVVIHVRAIGILKMIDGGEQDDKIVAVPVSAVGPTYDTIRTITDLPEIERQRLEAFFRVCKPLPSAAKPWNWPGSRMTMQPWPSCLRRSPPIKRRRAACKVCDEHRHDG